MNETDDWRTVTAPRADGDREWELFYRDDDGLRHAGSVSAPSEALAREQATTLFGHATDTLWLCPADETRRLTTREFGDADTTASGTDADDATTAAPEVEADDATTTSRETDGDSPVTDVPGDDGNGERRTGEGVSGR